MAHTVGKLLFFLGVLAPPAYGADPVPTTATGTGKQLDLPSRAPPSRAPKLVRDYRVFGGQHELGPFTLDARGAYPLDPDRNPVKHYEYALQLPLLADEVNRLTWFATRHYSDRSKIKDPSAWHEVTLAQSREFGFVTDTPAPGRSSSSTGVTLQHKASKDWKVDGTLGLLKIDGTKADKAAGKTRTKPFVQGNAAFSF